jgi:uncharacterized membrane protein
MVVSHDVEDKRGSVMRTTGDRIRHAISFEIIGLILIMPLGGWAFGMPMHDIGVVGLVSSLLATAWTYIYNLLFDHAMLKICGSVYKTFAVRLVHTLLYEVGLLLILVPFIAWYLAVTLMYAFLMDVAFAVFYMIYAFCFNWAYDRFFPIPVASGQ